MPTGNYTFPPEPCYTVLLQRGPRHAVCSPLSQVWYRDYRANDLLDAYEAEGIDEAPELEDMTLEEREEARHRAEREMNKRDRRENRRGLPGALEGVKQIADSDMLPFCPVPYLHACKPIFHALLHFQSICRFDMYTCQAYNVCTHALYLEVLRQVDSEVALCRVCK